MVPKMTYKTPLCSCIICRKLQSASGIGSHFLSHTPGVSARMSKNGKLGAIASTKVSKEKKIKDIELYLENPKLCTQCNEIIDYTHQKNTFCSRSCSAIFSNNRRTINGFKQSEKQKLAATNSGKLNYWKTRPKYTLISFCSVCSKCFPGTRKTCSTECRSTIFSNTAKNNPQMGGNKNTRAYGWYESPIAGKIWLESSYELKVAQELDLNSVLWNRPKYLPYGEKKYYADFYLVDYDVYLDPKNDYLITQDMSKINCVQEVNHVRIVVLNKNQLTWFSISKLIMEPRAEIESATNSLQNYCSTS